MDFFEKDLEDIIYESYLKDKDSLFDRGLNIKGFLKRQLSIGKKINLSSSLCYLSDFFYCDIDNPLDGSIIDINFYTYIFNAIN